MKTALMIITAVLAIWTVVATRWNPPEPAGKIPLVWVTDDNPARRGQIDLFNKLHPDLNLKLDPANGEVEKVIVQCMGGVGPDLFDSGDASQLATYVQAGIAWDVTDELKKRGMDPFSQVWSAIHPMGTVNDRTYGFGCNAAADAILYNKDIFDQEHIPYPKGPMRWDEFVKLAQRLTHRDTKGRIDRYGFMCDWGNWLNFAYSFGGRPYSDDGTHSTLSTAQNIEAVQFMRDLIYKYKVMPSPVDETAMATQGGWGTGVITYFGGGRTAMALGGRWWLTTLRDYKNLRIGVFEMPWGTDRAVRGYGRATLINARSPHREEALKFLIYQASKEYNDLINHQADGLGPMKTYAYTPTFEHDSAFPNEKDNSVWRDALEHAVADSISPFVSADTAGRIVTKQMDLIKAGDKQPAEALADADRQIDALMAKELKDNPELKARYDVVRRRE